MYNSKKQWYRDKTQVNGIHCNGVRDGVSYQIEIDIYSNGKRFFAIGSTQYTSVQESTSITCRYNGYRSKTYELLLKELRKDARQACTNNLTWNFTKEDARAVFHVWSDIINNFEEET